MLLSEKEHGAQLLTQDDERLYFDDLGCLIAWTGQNTAGVREKWVHTADTQTWLTVQQAHFAAAAHTPMDFGFIATQKPGTTTWPQVVEAVQAKLHRP